MTPTFSVRYISSVAPADVEFTDTYNAPEDRIWMFDFGDGYLFLWDTPDQTVVRHTYHTGGTYHVRATAIDHKTQSNPVSVMIANPPEPEPSWWQKLINKLISWLKSIGGIK
jgi:PKD repeat protein